MYLLLSLLFFLATLMSVPLGQAAGRVFFDGFESGNTNLWLQDDFRPKCPIVAESVDGVAGPITGTKMLRCNMQSGETYETLKLFTNYTDELFIRVRFRRDTNVSKPQKVLRFFQTSGVYHDLFEVPGHTESPSFANANACNPNNSTACPTYWWDTPGDNTNVPSSWHTIEYYIKQSTGTIKVWHDNSLIRNNTGYSFGGVKWTDFYITSNGDTGDSTNHTYYDDFEVYSDLGSGGTGLMSDGSIISGGGGPVVTVPNAPSNLVVE